MTARTVVPDVLAGLSIAGLLLPEAVAYSGVASLPPQAGVIGLFAGLLCAGTAIAGYGFLCRLTHSKGMIPTACSIIAAGVVYIVALMLTRTITRDDVLMLPKGDKMAEKLERWHALGE